MTILFRLQASDNKSNFGYDYDYNAESYSDPSFELSCHEVRRHEVNYDIESEYIHQVQQNKSFDQWTDSDDEDKESGYWMIKFPDAAYDYKNWHDYLKSYAILKFNGRRISMDKRLSDEMLQRYRVRFQYTKPNGKEIKLEGATMYDTTGQLLAMDKSNEEFKVTAFVESLDEAEVSNFRFLERENSLFMINQS